jgi:allantoate deiminase
MGLRPPAPVFFGLAAVAANPTIPAMAGKQAKSRGGGGGKSALRYGPALMAKLDELAAFTETPGQLTRRYLTPAHLASARQVLAWMRQAGMVSYIDPLANVVGRYDGKAPNARMLLLGSHIDTVVDAGRYDGALGVLAAIVAVGELARRGERLQHTLEIVAFGDEEGVRFPTRMLTSHALTGAVEPGMFDVKDSAGVSVREALDALGASAERYRECARSRDSVAAYLELHIEQGPVLHEQGRPMAAVTAINGATRMTLKVAGFAGHAGTVPMTLRRDALAAACEMVLAIERIGISVPGLVATVGAIRAHPGASNVIPGGAEFTIDVRSPEDGKRSHAIAEVLAAIAGIAARRCVEISHDVHYEMPATTLDPLIVETVSDAIVACGCAPLQIASGAGHDAMTMASFCPAGMIFLRCKDGISHNPAESITLEDADLAVHVLIKALRRLDLRLAV